MKLLAPVHAQSENNYRLYLDTINRVVNGGVTLGDNVPGKIVIATFETNVLELPVLHEFGFIPVGYIVLARSAPGVVYNGTSPWTDRFIFLKTSVAMTATIFIYAARIGG